MQTNLIGGLAAAVSLSCAACASQENAETLPFDLSSGRPVIELMVNGEGPFPFVFDTGAGGMMINSPLVDELELEITGSRLIGSPAGGEPVAVDTTELTTVSFGGARVENLPAIIIDFGAPGEMQSVGVIGPNAFAAYNRVAFDFASNTVEIGGDFHHDDTASWLDFSASAPIIEIPLTIGEITVPVHIDTGNPSILNFPEAQIEALPLAGPLQVVGEARTVDRVMQIMGAPIDATARLGDAEIPLTDITSFPLPFANMGSGALRGLYLEIDWENQRFAISGQAEPVNPRRRVAGAAADNE